MAFLDSMFDPMQYQPGNLFSRLVPSMAQVGMLGPKPQEFPGEDAALPQNAQPMSGPAPTAAFAQAAEQPQPPAFGAMAAPQQSGGILGGAGDWIGQNRNMLMMLGAGIAGGKDWGSGISAGLQGAVQGRKLDQAEGGSNLTHQALLRRGVDPETAAAAVRDPNVLKAILPNLFKPQVTSDITEYEYAKRQGFTGSLTDFLQRKRAGGGEYGLQPIWGTDSAGNPTILQLGKSGEAIQTRIPGGVQVGKDAIKVDAGTEWVLLDPVTRQTISRIPKDIEGKEAAEERGKAVGQAQVNLPNVIANAEQTLGIIDGVMKDPNRQLGTGMSSWTTYVPGTGAYDFGKKVEQLKGKAFLEAYQSLKGGGAITEIEGKKAENAIARLSTAQTEEGFMTALTELREIVVAGIGRAKQRAGQQAPAAAAGSADPLGIRR